MNARRQCFWATLLTLTLCPLSQARADEGALDVTLDVASCVRADSARVRRLFELELATSHAEAARAAQGARVELRCDGDLIQLSVHDPVTRKTLSRTIDPGPPAGRDRLLALAVLELLVASWVELETTPQPVGSPPGAPANSRARSTARAVVRQRIPKSSWSTSVLVGVGSQLSDQLHHGAGVRIARLSRGGWGYALGLSGRRAHDELSLGEVSITSFSSALMLLAHRRLESISLAGGAGVRTSIVSLDGQTDSAGVTAAEVTGFAGGPVAWGGFGLVLGSGMTLGIATEAGYYVLEVSGTVDGDRETGASGPWITANLEVGWTF